MVKKPWWQLTVAVCLFVSRVTTQDTSAQVASVTIDGADLARKLNKPPHFAQIPLAFGSKIRNVSLMARHEETVLEGAVTTWTGEVEGDPMSPFIVASGNKSSSMYCNVQFGGREFECTESESGGLTHLRDVTAEASVTEKEEDHGHDDLFVPLDESEQPYSGVGRRLQRDDDGSVIDVMFVYTRAARKLWGEEGLLERLASSIAWFNTANVNSGVLFSVNLVHAAEVDYKEDGNIGSALRYLSTANDGVMDEVQQLRDLYGADLVQLISTDRGTCGRSWITANPKWAYGVSSTACIMGRTPAHEFGHLMGLDHNYDATRKDRFGVKEYSYGFRVCGDFATVMSYSCPEGRREAKVPFWSSPRVEWNGTAMGSADRNDAARSLNEIRGHIARHRPSVSGERTSRRRLLSPGLSDGGGQTPDVQRVGWKEEAGAAQRRCDSAHQCL
eukprot:GDKH01000318.1.p1 GENE.GDKH01000318.1~~GDKH01000318.1.p1  ORF type:complete len:445 (-),score=84.38 GDKH01000318.1:123-1457(-)